MVEPPRTTRPSSAPRGERVGELREVEPGVPEEARVLARRHRADDVLGELRRSARRSRRAARSRTRARGCRPPSRAGRGRVYGATPARPCGKPRASGRSRALRRASRRRARASGPAASRRASKLPRGRGASGGGASAGGSAATSADHSTPSAWSDAVNGTPEPTRASAAAAKRRSPPERHDGVAERDAPLRRVPGDGTLRAELERAERRLRDALARDVQPLAARPHPRLDAREIVVRLRVELERHRAVRERRGSVAQRRGEERWAEPLEPEAHVPSVAIAPCGDRALAAAREPQRDCERHPRGVARAGDVRIDGAELRRAPPDGKHHHEASDLELRDRRERGGPGPRRGRGLTARGQRSSARAAIHERAQGAPARTGGDADSGEPDGRRLDPAPQERAQAGSDVDSLHDCERLSRVSSRNRDRPKEARNSGSNVTPGATVASPMRARSSTEIRSRARRSKAGRRTSPCATA